MAVSQITLAEIIRRRNAAGRAAFIPYLTAGDPSLEWTAKYLGVLETSGADIVEIGVPFSDPIADGPVNQRAAERALHGGATLQGIMDFFRSRREEGFRLPAVLFSYFNPILKMGLGNFAAYAKDSGLNGALVVDLPPEEAGDYLRVMRHVGLETIFLAAPTTGPERLKRIDKASSAFIYYVSRFGVTGTSRNLSETLPAEIKRLRQHTGKPLALGFGISDAVQAHAAAGMADAVVVGSALVRLVEEHGAEQACVRMGTLAADMARALARGGKEPRS
jgi:tryptophan synthase alpha chain